jgi:hypothetical protein
MKTLFRVTIAVILTLTLATCATAQAGNTSTGNDWAGGGVNLWHGTFTMSGGAISGNSAVGVEGSGGGGVLVGEGSTFIMSGGEISGNSAVNAGGVNIAGNGNTFTMNGGAIYGANEEGGRANIATGSGRPATMYINGDAKWGTGGTYTKGGVNQSGGSAIVTGTASRINTDDTLIAIPAR